MTRDNPHGEAAFRPEDYRFAFWFSNRPPMPPVAGVSREYVEMYEAAMERLREHRELLRAESSSVYSPVGQCAHCGNHIVYHVVYRHVPTGALLAIGEQCAENRLGRSNAEWKTYKAQLDRMREMAREGEKRIKVRERFPEAVALLEECLAEWQGINDGWTDQLDRDEEAYLAWRAAQRERDKAFRDRWPSFVVDVAEKLSRYNDLSEKQAAAVLKATREHRKRVERREEERANAKPVPEGRIEIEGVVVSTKWQESAYGGSVKMLVKADDGWKVWGTLPAAIDPTGLPPDEREARFPEGGLRGARVRFSATVERSDDDPTFGFFKRPTKAEILPSGCPKCGGTGTDLAHGVANPCPACEGSGSNRNGEEVPAWAE